MEVKSIKKQKKHCYFNTMCNWQMYVLEIRNRKKGMDHETTTLPGLKKQKQKSST